MTVPITPQYLASEVALDSVYITYKPMWDGIAWVVDPATVEIHATVLLVDGENPVIHQTKVFPYAALTQQGKNRVNNIRTFFEQRVASGY